MPADYEALARRGMNVRGKFVVARYSVGWRGPKPKLAQDHGAAGTMIYSDPADDGYGQGDPYPKRRRAATSRRAARVGGALAPAMGEAAERPFAASLPHLADDYGRVLDGELRAAGADGMKAIADPTGALARGLAALRAEFLVQTGFAPDVLAEAAARRDA